VSEVMEKEMADILKRLRTLEMTMAREQYSQRSPSRLALSRAYRALDEAKFTLPCKRLDPPGIWLDIDTIEDQLKDILFEIMPIYAISPLPCPHCDSTDLAFGGYGSWGYCYGLNTVWIQCQKCLATGGMVTTHRCFYEREELEEPTNRLTMAVIRRWNQRRGKHRWAKSKRKLAYVE